MQRLRKVSDSIIQVVAPRPERQAPRRRPSYRGGKQENIEVIGLSYTTEKEALEDLSFSSPEYPKYAQEQHAIDNWHRAKQVANTNTIAFPSSSPKAARSTHRDREKPVPVPMFNPRETTQQDSCWSPSSGTQITLPYRPPLESRTPTSTQFATVPTKKPHRRPPISSSAHFAPSSSTPTAPFSSSTRIPREATSIANVRDSVYFSSGPATVRRQGAIRRTSSTGHSNLPPQHPLYSHKSEQSVDSATSLAAPTRGPRHTPPPPSRPTHSMSERPPYAQREAQPPYHIPHDASSQTDCTDSPRSSVMMLSHAPVARASVVAKVQANLRVQDAAVRPVRVSSGPGTHLQRAMSHKAQIVHTSSPPPQRQERLKEGRREPRREPGRVMDGRTEETYGIEIYDRELAQAQYDQGRTRGGTRKACDINATRSGTQSLAIRHGSLRGKDVNRKRGH